MVIEAAMNAMRFQARGAIRLAVVASTLLVHACGGGGGGYMPTALTDSASTGTNTPAVCPDRSAPCQGAR